MPKDKSAKSAKSPPLVFDPAGWDDRPEAWPFAAEVSFWTLPDDELEAAFRWELRRERNRRGLIDDFWTVPDAERDFLQVYGPEPWLTLPDIVRGNEVDRHSNFFRPPAVEIATPDDSRRAFSSMQGSKAIHTGRCPSDDERRANSSFPKYHEGLLVTLKIDLAQGRKAIRQGLAEIMQQLDLPSKTGEQTDAEKNLRALAVLRAKYFSDPRADWMRFFRSTPYAGKKDEQKQRIREAEKLLGC